MFKCVISVRLRAFAREKRREFREFLRGLIGHILPVATVPHLGPWPSWLAGSGSKGSKRISGSPAPPFGPTDRLLASAGSRDPDGWLVSFWRSEPNFNRLNGGGFRLVPGSILPIFWC